MGKTCADPMCKTGNRGFEKRRVGPKPRFYRFRDNWRQSVPNGAGIKISKNTYLCSEHFALDCYQSQRIALRKDRGDALVRRLLKIDAIPTIWPDHNCNNTKTTSVPVHSTEELRQEPQQNSEPGMKSTDESHFESLNDIAAKVRGCPENITIIQDHDHLVLLSISTTSGQVPKIKFGINIDTNLAFETFCCDSFIKNSDLGLPLDVKLTKHLTLMNIFKSLDKIYSNIQNLQIQSAIHNLESSRGDDNDVDEENVVFLREQLKLLTKVPKARRYPPSLLSTAVYLHSISPACYKFLRESLLLLPSDRHLRRLTSAITPDLGLSQSTIAYLKGRFSKLEDKDKIVGVIIDEVHCEKKVQYANGQFFGLVNGVITKSLLCVMIRSVAGKYRDVVCMSPIANINAEMIRTVWLSCLEVVTDIGFDAVFTMTDGLDANVRFFKLISGGETKIQNPFDAERSMILLFDTVHIFKNIYNNLLKYGVFKCPSFKNKSTVLTARFSHIVGLYNIELTMPIKRAHKLTAKMLNPSSIEKTNVRLADACFHESTINALKFYSSKGYPQFLETAEVFSIFRDWFNTVNVKSRDVAQRKRDERRTSVDKNTINHITQYLNDFKIWVETWSMSGKNGLSRSTFSALLQTTSGLVQLLEYLIHEKHVEYINTGNIQSDALEGRFRSYRQLHGADYLCATLQFLQAEKTLRIQALVKDGFTMQEIKELFEGEIVSAICNEELPLGCLEDCRFEDMDIDDDDKSIILYYAGYISRKLLQRKPSNFCVDCIQMISSGVVTNSSKNPHAEFALSVSRGGLLEPSDAVFITAQHAKYLYEYISNNEHVKMRMSQENPRETFVNNFLAKLEQEGCTRSLIMESKCIMGHPFRPYVRSIAVAMFNCFAVNVANEANSRIHEEKKRMVLCDNSRSERKIRKLTSGGSAIVKLS